MMHEDPIIAEVRKAGQAMAEQAGGDVHVFFENLRSAQQRYRDRLADAPRRPVHASESK
jgi:hypothetical protein